MRSTTPAGRFPLVGVETVGAGFSSASGERCDVIRGQIVVRGQGFECPVIVVAQFGNLLRGQHAPTGGFGCRLGDTYVEEL